MIAYINWAAKAVVAFAIPLATLLVDVGAGWLNVAEDGIIGLDEGQAFALSVLLAVGVFLKGNSEKPS